MAPPQKPIYVIDGANFSDFAGFVEECNRAFIRSFGGEWTGGSWMAFHDYFSWAEGEYILVWKRFDLASDAVHAEFNTIMSIIEDQAHVELRLE